MGNDYFTPYDTSTQFTPESMNPPLQNLDKVIGYRANPAFTFDYPPSFNILTSKLTWAKGYVVFNRSDGKMIHNHFLTGDFTMTPDSFVYLTVTETDGDTATFGIGSFTGGSASLFNQFNRFVFAYRGTDTAPAVGIYCPVYVQAVIEPQHITSGSSVTLNWNKGKTAWVTVAHDIAWTFTGGALGDILMLQQIQDDSGGHTPTYPGTIRYGTEYPSLDIDPTARKTTYAEFFCNIPSSEYDLIRVVKGYGPSS